MKPDVSAIDPIDLNLATRLCFGDALTRLAQTFPERLAVIDGDVELSYGELDCRTDALARGLVDFVDYQQPVAIMLRNSWQFLTTFFACAKTGRVAVPITLLLSDIEVAHVLSECGATTIIADQEFLPRLEKILSEASLVERVIVIGAMHADEAAGIPIIAYDDVLKKNGGPVEMYVDDRDIVRCLFTSGTTSGTKGVLTSHAAVHVAALSTALCLDHRRWSPSVQPIVLPLFHCAAQDSAAFPTMLTGGTLILFRAFDAGEILNTIQDRGATHVLLLPDMWRQMLAEQETHPRDVSSLRLCHYAMTPMPANRMLGLRVNFPNANVLLGFGQTEFTPPTTFQWAEHQVTKSDSVGLPVVTTDVRIMGEDGSLKGPGVTGEIVYRGPQALSGYLNDPAATAAVFAHGWFHSGDLGQIDEDRVIWFVDRLKDVVKSGGENVSSLEVERTLLGHADVADCAVIGMVDEKWGEVVTAFVIRRKESAVSAEELREFAGKTLARFKIPKAVVFVDSLPRTTTGKIRKTVLRESFSDVATH